MNNSEFTLVAAQKPTKVQFQVSESDENLAEIANTQVKKDEIRSKPLRKTSL